MKSELLHIGFIQIHSYGLMLAVAFVVGIWWTRREMRIARLPADWPLDAAVYVIILSILLARLAYVVMDLPYYLAEPSTIFQVQLGGLSVHGGIAGGMLGLYIFFRRRGWGMLRYGEPILPALALSTAIGRIGCFLNGCCYGAPCELPWAFALPELGDGVPRHPAQLYALALNLMLFFALVALRNHRRKGGDWLAYYLIGYGIVRFVVEIFRAGVSSVVGWGGLTYAQWMSLGLVAAGLVFFFAPLGKKLERTP